MVVAFASLFVLRASSSFAIRISSLVAPRSQLACSFRLNHHVVVPLDGAFVASKLFALALIHFMKRYLPFIIVGGVALATLGSGAMLYRAKLPQLLTIPEDKVLPGKGGAESMHIRGNPDAPITLEEFGDFQCPPCGNIAVFIDELVKEYDPRLRLVFRNFPLSNHGYAREAALAAEAAGLQARFWEMHDVLYREQSVWSNADNARELFESYAGMLGLDLNQFKKDMDSDKARQRVEADEARGNSLGIKATPTLFVDNREMGPNDRNPEGARRLIDEAVKAKSPASEKK
jgi:predicted DsbA family dithiol-disulfide isomerase